jgi:NADH-ubiquinone oxidoreductase chain 2
LIPPLIGFFGKQSVLFSAIGSGYFFMAFVAIVVSVISASYYLKIIRELHSEKKKYTSEIGSINMSEINSHAIDSNSTLFNKQNSSSNNGSSFVPHIPLSKVFVRGLVGAANNTYLNLTNTHAFIIAFLTLSIIFYVLKPSILLNSAVLSTLSLFYF